MEICPKSTVYSAFLLCRNQKVKHSLGRKKEVIRRSLSPTLCQTEHACEVTVQLPFDSPLNSSKMSLQTVCTANSSVLSLPLNCDVKCSSKLSALPPTGRLIGLPVKPEQRCFRSSQEKMRSGGGNMKRLRERPKKGSSTNKQATCEAASTS